jgi:hypothetical protein
LTFSISSSHVYIVFDSLYNKLSLSFLLLCTSAKIPLNKAYLYFFVIFRSYSVKSISDLASTSILLYFKHSYKKVWSFASELPKPYGKDLSKTRLNCNKLTIFIIILCKETHNSLHNLGFSFSWMKFVMM